mmetsp:Transcript_31948/g.62421  ORF Transcript_31948/g.62421 Transcript_31948/m.62421 type:complete len:169 (+) Transcript_31948:407-913(+)
MSDDEEKQTEVLVQIMADSSQLYEDPPAQIQEDGEDEPSIMSYREQLTILQNRLLELQYVCTQQADNRADFLTKSTVLAVHQKMTHLLLLTLGDGRFYAHAEYASKLAEAARLDVLSVIEPIAHTDERSVIDLLQHDKKWLKSEHEKNQTMATMPPKNSWGPKPTNTW